MRVPGKPMLKGRSTDYVPYGVSTAMVTPFSPDGELDERTLRQLVAWQIEAGVHGLMCCGGTGEFVCLTDEERLRVLEITLDESAGRVPVLAGVLTPSTRHAVSLARAAEQLGAQAALVLTPYYINPSTDGTYEHFARIADSTSIPIILYNNPGRTKIDMAPDVLRSLAEIPTVVGLKECQRDLALVAERIGAVGDQIAVLSGEDDLALPTWFLGSPGCIVATSSLLPDIYVRMWEEAREGNLEQALEIHYQMLPVIRSFYVQNHPGPLKQMLAWAGHPVGFAREPLAKVSPAAEQQMKAVLKSLGRLATVAEDR